MSSMEVAGITIFILLLFLGIYATVFSLPGTILITVTVFCYALLTGFDKIGFKVIFLLIVMTVISESIGLFMEMKSKIRFTPTLKGILVSFAGSLLGVMALTPLLLGLGMLLGIFLGGFAGFFGLEMVRQSTLKPAFRASFGAILATVTGIFVKGFFAIAMTALTLLNIYS